MKRRHWIVGLVLFAAAGSASVLWASGALAMWRAPIVSRAADAPPSAGHIAVGPTVHISGTRAGNAHYGCTVAADPARPERLLAASMHVPEGGGFGVVGYYSHDGGATWQLSLERVGRTPEDRCCDEAVAFTADGEVAFAHMRGDFGNDLVGVNHASVDLLRSSDGGVTWTERVGIEGWVDRPQLAFDLTNGPHRGRMYCNANNIHAASQPVAQTGEDQTAQYTAKAAVYVSGDAGSPLTAATIPERDLLTAANSNPVVLADGTVVVAYFRSEQAARNPHRITIWRSSDGGRSFTEASRVPTMWRHTTTRAQGIVASGHPRLAAAPAGPTSARLYCVWDDGSLVLFSSSADRGETWSAPIVISEQDLDAGKNDGYFAGMPAVAVNGRGEIAVAWYDRRGLPPATVDTNGWIHKPGYNLRIRVSTDEGRTWRPSVQLNERSGRGEVLDVRFWGLSMAAGSDGRFHPAWVADSDGTLQLWTAGVTVE